MSLINDALKKAQHQRTGGVSDAPPMPGGGSGGARGRSGMPRGTLVLLIAGATVVVIISVVATVFFINRTPTPKVATAAPAVTPAVPSSPTDSASRPAATVSLSPSPVIIAPVIIKAPAPVVETPPAPAATATPATPASGSTASPAANVAATAPNPAPAPASATPSTATPSPAAAAPAAEPVVEGTLTDRINNYVDKVRVTGIRTSENGSKVLMNDHVYRLNDIVDRKLGLRLVKIGADSLTFADATGATYVKSF